MGWGYGLMESAVMLEIDVFDLIKKRDFNALIKAVESDRQLTQLHGAFSTTILHQSAEVASPEIIKCLVDLGCNIHALDDENRTPIWWAIDSSNHAVVDYLLEQGADLDVMDKDGTFPIHEVARYNEVRDIDFLLSRGVAIDQKTNGGCTALHYAVMSANLELIEFLINKGANVNEQENTGYTPLHYAALAYKMSHQIPEYSQVIELLISRGADILIESEDGETAEDLAEKTAQRQIAELLTRHREDRLN